MDSNGTVTSLQQGLELGNSVHSRQLLKLAKEALEGDGPSISPDLWHLFLDITRHPAWLKSLGSSEIRDEWAETVFKIIDISNYSLELLFKQRVQAHPDHPFLQEVASDGMHAWSYKAVFLNIRTIAAVLFTLAPDSSPRVGIISANTLANANCDLACLVHDILVTPLSPHLNQKELAWIFEKLQLNIVAVGSAALRDRVSKVIRQHDFNIKVLLLDPGIPRVYPEEIRLHARCARTDEKETVSILENRERKTLHQTLTVMFTSGSTGHPKGIRYSAYNLLTKRFARAASLPDVGTDEILLCYLPLYHTFGRYLELMGSLFWGGTYVFTGNPSFETLLYGLQRIQPTGLISIPRRWQQIKNSCLTSFGKLGEGELRDQAFRQVTGKRLRWGLSAAGVLNPQSFHFFQKYGVELCSGFGMTEATGGITMTPPGKYIDHTVGIPLPGMEVRLVENNELEISGPYIGRYLDDPEPDPPGEYWMATGDVFKQHPNGYLEIVDRVKDLYKNNKGQTIAPVVVEQLLDQVPGIKRCFLVGDGKAYNVLLIVPDPGDPILDNNPDPEGFRDYFDQVITAVNADLAPYERVVNFAVLDRDFSLGKGELTPKGSLRRKVIEQHFNEIIDQMYQQDHIEIDLKDYALTVQIPRWFFRDLGILETDIVAKKSGLFNKWNKKRLRITINKERGTTRIGDLEYRLKDTIINLGLFARQPLLWFGNPALVEFCPCRDGWDYPLTQVSQQIFLSADLKNLPDQEILESQEARQFSEIRDRQAVSGHILCVKVLFFGAKDARESLAVLAEMLPKVSLHTGNAIRRRLEALAFHPDFKVRCDAYRILIMDEQIPDYSRMLPTFLLSGKSFLSKESMEEISLSGFERFRLIAFRKRLLHYRTVLSASQDNRTVRAQMNDVFSLLGVLVKHHPKFYTQIRAELVSWLMDRRVPSISRLAKRHLEKIVNHFEDELTQSMSKVSNSYWLQRIVFDAQLSLKEKRDLKTILINTTFLKESIILAFDEFDFSIQQVPSEGIWISKVFSFQHRHLYRASINTVNGKHLDLLIAIQPEEDQLAFRSTTHWMVALHDRPDAYPVVRQFGCYRPELRAMSMGLVNELTVWEKIRDYAEAGIVEILPSRRQWRNLFIRGLQAFFAGWIHSDKQIVPGPVSPMNVAVHTADFRTDIKILSLVDWNRFKNPLSMIKPMLRNFFQQTVSHYPATLERLDLKWLLEACVEAAGVARASEFLEELHQQMLDSDLSLFEKELEKILPLFISNLEDQYFVPLSIRCAVERYHDWLRSNPGSTAVAREYQIKGLMNLYQIDSHDDIGRYYLYRHTYFTETSPATREAFDELIRQMFLHPEKKPLHMLELSILQSALEYPSDRLVFSRLLFPTLKATEPVDVLTIGRGEEPQVVVASLIKDNRGERYTLRDVVNPAEIGKLHKIFLETGLSMNLGQREKFLVLLDNDEEVAGGICYRMIDHSVAQLDGVAVLRSLNGRSLGGQLLEDFCSRMSSQGVRMVNTQFISREFYTAHGFRVNERWSGLVRFLRKEDVEE
jgi:long-chain acyl-CoA synthetase